MHNLPVHRTITLRKDKFDEREDDFYEALYTQSQAQFATYVQSGTVVNNYAHIFDLLIRLRQVHFSLHALPPFLRPTPILWQAYPMPMLLISIFIPDESCSLATLLPQGMWPQCFTSSSSYSRCCLHFLPPH